MNREELLKELGLSEAEFQDLLQKFDAFFASLDENQQAVVSRSLPSTADVLATLGPGANEADLQKLFKGEKHHPPVCIFFFAKRNS